MTGTSTTGVGTGSGFIGAGSTTALATVVAGGVRGVGGRSTTGPLVIGTGMATAACGRARAAAPPIIIDRGGPALSSNTGRPSGPRRADTGRGVTGYDCRAP